jgi:HEAT repeat protein
MKHVVTKGKAKAKVKAMDQVCSSICSGLFAAIAIFFFPASQIAAAPGGGGSRRAAARSTTRSAAATNRIATHAGAIRSGGFCARLHAVDALRKVASPKGVGALSRALNDRSRFVRQAAVAALCKIHHVDAARALLAFGAKRIAAKGDASMPHPVRQKGMKKRGKKQSKKTHKDRARSGDEKKKKTKSASAKITHKLVTCLGQMRQVAFPVLRAVLSQGGGGNGSGTKRGSGSESRSRSERGRKGSARASAKRIAVARSAHGQNGVKRRTRQTYRQVLACWVLAQTSHSKAFRLLKTATKNRAWRVRKAAIEALAIKGQKRKYRRRAAAVVAARLKDRSKAVRRAAVRALERIGKPGVRHLIKALRRAKMDVRIEAARALGRMKARRARRSLRRATRRRNKNLRAEACLALTRIGKRSQRCRKIMRKNLMRMVLTSKSGTRAAVDELLGRSDDSSRGRVDVVIAVRRGKQPRKARGHGSRTTHDQPRDLSSLSEARRRCRHSHSRSRNRRR